jgi:hypothetical protein
MAVTAKPWSPPKGIDITGVDLSLMGGVADILAPMKDPMAADPVGWILKHTFIWSKQQEICEAVRDHRFTAVRSAHGTGKSFIAAWIICWWMATHDDAVVVTSAPSANQVKNILWKEIRRAHTKSALPGYITQGEIPEWKLDGEVVAWGRKPADYTDPDEARTRFQGIHSKHVLVVLDEGSGIPAWLAGAAEDLVTNENSRILIIGNPTNPASYFADVSKPGSDYHRIKISAFDLPAFTGEYVPDEVADVLTGKMWVDERRKKWGEDSMYWTAKVLAEFPLVAEDILFTPAILQRGIAADLSRNAVTKKRGTGGLDVARMGEDETVLYINKFGYVRIQDRWGKLDTMETVARFKRNFTSSRNNPGAAPFTWIDVTGGLGTGPFDRLREQGYPVGEFNFGGGARDRTKFRNRRAEAYYEAMEAMDQGRIDIDELDEELQRELMEHRFKENSTGLIQIEAKEEIAKRLGHSPDRADAFVMAMQQASGAWIEILTRPEERGQIDPTRPPEKREVTPEDLVKDVMDVLF